MAVLKQSTTYSRMFKMISSVDHLSLKTGASPVVNISKAGAAFGAAAGTVTEIANGWYKVALTTADTNTVGDLAFYITGTSADDTDFSDQVSSVILSDIPTTTPLTSAQIATGVWTDTTAGDFTVASSVGKSVINGVSLGTGLTVNALTTNNDKTGYSLAVAPPTSAAIATAVWTDTTAGDFTVASSIGKSVLNGVTLGTGLTINAYTGNTAQTGDAYARLGAPAGASTAADIAAVKTDTGNIVTTTNKFVFTVANKVDSNVLNINGNSTAAQALAQSTQSICWGTCSGGTVTTAVVSTLNNPSSLTDSGQLIGRTIIFLGNSTTSNMDAQASNITASSTGSTPTITFTAMTHAPANGDVFVIL
jgi:hypothetical protein